MKYSLLDYVQAILNDMDSDEVNSVADTIESEQVAQIVKDSYFAMMSNRNWPHLRRTIQLLASGNPALPTHMTLQDEIKELISFSYNCAKSGETRKRYKPIKFLEPDSFLRLLNPRDNTQNNIDIIIDPTGVDLMIQNDRHPQYFTSFNDTQLVFDSYDSSVDSTLQNSKVQAMAYVMPLWEYDDEFVPDLPMEAVTALLEEAKSRAMLRLKQTQDVKAEMEAKRQQTWLSRKARRVNGGISYPSYGRGCVKVRDVTFNRGYD